MLRIVVFQTAQHIRFFLQKKHVSTVTRDNKLDGTVYMMDDDNTYDPRLFQHLRFVKANHVAIFAVRRWAWANEALIEMPVYKKGRFQRFQAGWCYRGWLVKTYGHRHFCVDMGGFAFDASLLHDTRSNLWNESGFKNRHGGENELLIKLLGANYDLNRLQPLVDCGSTVYVFHNEYRSKRHDDLSRVCPCPHRFNPTCKTVTNCTTSCVEY